MTLRSSWWSRLKNEHLVVGQNNWWSLLTNSPDAPEVQRPDAGEQLDRRYLPSPGVPFQTNGSSGERLTSTIGFVDDFLPVHHQVFMLLICNSHRR
jgi:hypothetical protein